MTKVVDLHNPVNYATHFNNTPHRKTLGGGIASSVLQLAPVVAGIDSNIPEDVRVTALRAFTRSASFLNVVCRHGLELVSDLITIEFTEVYENHVKYLVRLHGHNPEIPLITIQVSSSQRMHAGKPLTEEIPTMEEIPSVKKMNVFTDGDIANDAVIDTYRTLVDSLIGSRRLFNRVGSMGDNMGGYSIVNTPIPGNYLICVDVVAPINVKKPYDVTVLNTNRL